MITLALVGEGRWGSNYLKASRSIPDCHIKYVVSPHINEETILPNDPVRLSDYRKLSSFSDIDGVIIATPFDTHVAIASDLMKHISHLLIEKPIATSLRELKQLTKQQKHYNSHIFAGHIYLYNEGLQVFKKHLSKLGKLYLLESIGGKRYENSRQYPTPVVWEWGPHEISIIRLLTKSSPHSVCAWKIADTDNHTIGVVAKLEFGNDFCALLKFGTVFDEKTRLVRAVGKKGSLSFDDTTSSIQLITDSKYHIPFTAHRTPLENELIAFMSSIKYKRDRKNDLQETFEITRILESIELSIHYNGRKIAIKI